MGNESDAVPSFQWSIVTLKEQARFQDSPLWKFLDDHLPHRGEIATAWRDELGDTYSDNKFSDPVIVGQAFERRIGLDLADHGGWWPILNFLGAENYASLLEASGFVLHSNSVEGRDTGTTDPVLRRWERAYRPDVIDEKQLDALRLLAHVVTMVQVDHKLSDFFTVEDRRGMLGPLRRADLEPDVDDLSSLWQRYLDNGRRQMLSLGVHDRVLVGPVIVPTFAEADLVVGSTLVEIKVSTKHESEMLAWLNQILGYVLLDRWNGLRVDHIGIYSARHGRLLTVSLAELVTRSRHGHPIKVEALRNELRRALRDDLERAEADAAKQRFQA